MPESLYAKPSNLLTYTPTSVGTSEDADFPLTNLGDVDPETVAKAVAVTGTLRLTRASAAVEGVVAVNVNWREAASVLLTTNGGVSNEPALISPHLDDLAVNAWWDLRGEGGNATQVDIAVTGAPSALAVGEVLWIAAWDEFRFHWDYTSKNIRPEIKHRTGHRKLMRYRIPVKYRVFNCNPFDAADRNALRELRDEADLINPWVLVPEADDEHAYLVQFTDEEESETYNFYRNSFRQETVEGIVEMPFEAEELVAGVRLEP